VLVIALRLGPHDDPKSSMAPAQFILRGGNQAADITSGIRMTAPRCVQVLRVAEGYWRDSQASPVHRTMPGKRLLPAVAPGVSGRLR
jgi:hypothetical protein